MRQLLVSVRGSNEAIAAAKGGAHIADVEFPASALGTPYPLNIKAVREELDRSGFGQVHISTNIGEEQPVRSTACQAALGVALAGADYVKCGLAGLSLSAASYLGRNLVRTVREWFPEKKVYPAVFADDELAHVFNPLVDGPELVREIDCDGLLIDTFDKHLGKGLLDYYSVLQIADFVANLHERGKEVWLAGSVTHKQLFDLWTTGVDVVCVRGAACLPSEAPRFGRISSKTVSDLVGTMPTAET